MNDNKVSVFKRGDKIVCIDNSISNSPDFNIVLTYGKVYEVYADSIVNRVTETELVYVDDDIGMGNFFSSHRFILLSEYRSRVINEILL